MTTPLVLLTGVARPAMDAAALALLWDAPNAIAVQHDIDVDRQVLTRTVSDATGLLERVEIELEHACVSCALREDVLPTIERLAAEDRWATIVVRLPVSADATQVCRVVESESRSLVHVAQVLAVIDGPAARADLVGEELLAERGIHTMEGDRRGVAETHAAQVEYADVAVVVRDVDAADRDLVSLLLRPGATLVDDHLALDGRTIAEARRPYDDAEDWVDPLHVATVGLRTVGAGWTVELRSDRPFHPDRFMEHLGRLGAGPRRSRGCFWLPTRPDQVCQWDGAGGQVSVGVCSHDTSPHTRLLVTGDDLHRAELAEVFAHCLLTDDEVRERGLVWESVEDGLEPWLGPVRRAA